jgi:hypothetical protein
MGIAVGMKGEKELKQQQRKKKRDGWWLLVVVVVVVVQASKGGETPQREEKGESLKCTSRSTVRGVPRTKALQVAVTTKLELCTGAALVQVQRPITGTSLELGTRLNKPIAQFGWSR